MDNVTHALAGMLMADATTSLVAARSGTTVPDRFRRAAVVVGIAAAELPDLDVFYAGSILRMGPLGYLLHHRGHTHTIVWAVIGALLLWAGGRWWFTRGAIDSERRWFTAHGSRALLGLALVGALSHLALDFTNSYGVHPFWPFDDRWYYGDAVFIVEPWLWVVAIPALLWRPRATAGRVILTLLLLVILAAAWRIGEVARAVAMTLSVCAVVWLFVQRGLSNAARTASGIGAWLMVTMLFFVASHAAEALVAKAVDRTTPGALADVVLTPAVGDPTCWSAMAVSTDGVSYRLSTGVIAPYPRVRTVSDCQQAYPSARLQADALQALSESSPVVPFDSSTSVRWNRTWVKTRSEFTGLANERCEVMGALRFMRTPVWTVTPDGTLQMSDARYGVGGGFASMTLRGSPLDCTLTHAWVPPWVPPRRDMLLVD